MRYKLLIAPLAVFLFLMLTPIQANAQTPPFPQVGQNWTYLLTGSADWAVPANATTSYTATAKYTVQGAAAGEVSLFQEVTGSVVWNATGGSGTIVYLENQNGSLMDKLAPSNTNFAFSTTGTVSLNDSKCTGISGDQYYTVLLNWSSAGNPTLAWVGPTIWMLFPFAFPPFFLTEDKHTIVYQNTSYDPFGDFSTGNGPTQVNPGAWVADSLTTAFGVRQVMKNITSDTGSFLTQNISLEMGRWIDKDTGILLKYTDYSHAWGAPFVYNITTTIELISCDFFGILGFLLYTKLFGIALLYIIIAVVVLVVVLVVVAVLVRRRGK